MIKQIPSYLKLLTDSNSEAPVANEDLASMTNACLAFEQATGWRLEVAWGSPPVGISNLMWSAPVNPGVGNAPGHIRLLSPGKHPSGHAPIPLERAKQMAAALARLWSELLSTRGALSNREAELAAGVPVVARHRDEQWLPLAQRLEAVLRAGAQAIGCDAAALYLLDPATTELKLRACWGLPHNRLAAPARPLRGALADLEALLGHAVVTNDERLYDYWKVPELGFSACLCVPLLSQAMPLGTLWAFSRQPRDFTPVQSNIYEVVAGRIAADLERETLLDEALSAREQVKQLGLVEQTDVDSLPTMAPVLAGWDIAASSEHAGPLSSTLYDWFATDKASGLAVVVGDTAARGIDGAVAIATLRSAARALGTQPIRPGQLLEKTNAVVWTTSSGRHSSGMCHAILKPDDDTCVLAAAGPLRAIALGADGPRVLASPTPALGSDDQLRPVEARHRVVPGELIVIYGTSFLPSPDAAEYALVAIDTQLDAALRPHGSAPSQKLAELAQSVLAAMCPSPAANRVVAILQRRIEPRI
ncbi:MAG TPA: SpoIIE family protein phosphatase [Pirellulales bacterium]|nr:SpoIIE family protein phosphatase [Pirellulales bacterium]